MKTLTLTIGERLAALKIFDAFKGSVTELVTIMDDVKQLVITPEDWTAANRVVTKTDTGEQWKWDEATEATWKEVTLQAASVSYLLKSINEKTDVTIADIALISLSNKLK
jgi:hypothetical protein